MPPFSRDHPSPSWAGVRWRGVSVKPRAMFPRTLPLERFARPATVAGAMRPQEVQMPRSPSRPFSGSRCHPLREFEPPPPG